MIDPFDSEGISDHVYKLANVDPQAPIGAEALALRIPGIVAVRHDALRMLGRSAHTRGPDGFTIWLHPRASHVARNYDTAHEIAEIVLTREQHELIERAANQGAGAICAPRPAFQRFLGACGEDFGRLATAFVVTESCAILRFGEVTGTPLVLVTPGTVYVRGDEWGWPPEHDLRRLARAKTLPPQLRRVSVGDDRRRVVIVAA